MYNLNSSAMKKMLVLLTLAMSALCAMGQAVPDYVLHVSNDTTYVCRSRVFTFYGNVKGRVILRASANTVPCLELEVSSGNASLMEFVNSFPKNTGDASGLEGQKVKIVTGNGSVGVLETVNAKVFKSETDDIGAAPNSVKFVIAMSLGDFTASRVSFETMPPNEVARRVCDGLNLGAFIDLIGPYGRIMVIPAVGGNRDWAKILRNMYLELREKVPEAFAYDPPREEDAEAKEKFFDAFLYALGARKIPKVESKVEENHGFKEFASMSEYLPLHRTDSVYVDGIFVLRCSLDEVPVLRMSLQIARCPQIVAFFKDLSNGLGVSSNQSMRIEMPYGEFLTTDKARLTLFECGDFEGDDGRILKDAVILLTEVSMDALVTNSDGVAGTSAAEAVAYFRKLLSEENLRSVTIGGVKLPFDMVSTAKMYERMFSDLDSLMPARQKPQAVTQPQLVSQKYLPVLEIDENEVFRRVETPYGLSVNPNDYCKFYLDKSELSDDDFQLYFSIETSDAAAVSRMRSMHFEPSGIAGKDGPVEIRFENGSSLVLPDQHLMYRLADGNERKGFGYETFILNIYGPAIGSKDDFLVNGTASTNWPDKTRSDMLYRLFTASDIVSVAIDGHVTPFTNLSTFMIFRKMFAHMDVDLPEVGKIEPTFSSWQDGSMHIYETPVVKYYAVDGTVNGCIVSLVRNAGGYGMMLDLNFATADKDIAKIVKKMDMQPGGIMRSDGHKVMLTLENGEQFTVKDVYLSGSMLSGGNTAIICNLPLGDFISDRAKLNKMTSAQRYEYVVNALSVNDIVAVSFDKKPVPLGDIDTSELLKKMFAEIR